MKSHLLIIVLYMVGMIAADPAFDYCTMNCTIDGNEVKHIACNNDGKFNQALCPPDAKIVQLNEAWKQFFVDEHNNLRNFVAGGGNSTYKYKPACRMATIQWDEGLAKHAELNAKLCGKVKNLCHGTVDYPDSGAATEMVYFNWYTTATKTIINSVKNWSNYFLTERSITDILVDRNIRLGCAVSSSKASSPLGDDPPNNIWTTCYYSTNIPNFSPSLYAECEYAAEECSSGTNYIYTNLCSRSEKYE